jgi:hypothetical protein
MQLYISVIRKEDSGPYDVCLQSSLTYGRVKYSEAIYYIAGCRSGVTYKTSIPIGNWIYLLRL